MRKKLDKPSQVDVIYALPVYNILWCRVEGLPMEGSIIKGPGWTRLQTGSQRG
jgi:hypothetical protein